MAHQRIGRAVMVVGTIVALMSVAVIPEAEAHHPEVIGATCVLVGNSEAVQGVSASWLQDPNRDGQSGNPDIRILFDGVEVAAGAYTAANGYEFGFGPVVVTGRGSVTVTAYAAAAFNNGASQGSFRSVVVDLYGCVPAPTTTTVPPTSTTTSTTTTGAPPSSTTTTSTPPTTTSTSTTVTIPPTTTTVPPSTTTSTTSTTTTVTTVPPSTTTTVAPPTTTTSLPPVSTTTVTEPPSTTTSTTVPPTTTTSSTIVTVVVVDPPPTPPPPPELPRTGPTGLTIALIAGLALVATGVYLVTREEVPTS